MKPQVGKLSAPERGRELTQRQQQEIVQRAYEAFDGQLDDLAEAIGAFMLGQRMGFIAVRMVWSRPRLNKFEQILGVKLADVMPFETPDSTRCSGVRYSKKFDEWWHALAVPKHREWKVVSAGKGAGK